MRNSFTPLDQMRRSLAIAKKNIKIYYSKGPVIIFGMITPAFFFFSYAFGRQVPLSLLVPGLPAMTVFSISTAITPAVAPWETQARTLERLISCPVTVSTILLGDMLASASFGMVISIIPIIIGLVTGATFTNPFILAIGIILASLCFSIMGLLLSSPPTGTPSNIMMLSSLVRFPLVFISGIFLPLSELPFWGRVMAAISPLTYFTDLARYCVNGKSYYAAYIDLLVILTFTIVFWVVAVKLHERTMPQRV